MINLRCRRSVSAEIMLLDYAGPFFVKNIYEISDKNVLLKCWLVLYL